MKFLKVTRDKMNESGPVGIEVVLVFIPNSLCSCFGQLVAHL